MLLETWLVLHLLLLRLLLLSFLIRVKRASERAREDRETFTAGDRPRYCVTVGCTAVSVTMCTHQLLCLVSTNTPTRPHRPFAPLVCCLRLQYQTYRNLHSWAREKGKERDKQKHNNKTLEKKLRDILVWFFNRKQRQQTKKTNKQTLCCAQSEKQLQWSSSSIQLGFLVVPFSFSLILPSSSRRIVSSVFCWLVFLV